MYLERDPFRRKKKFENNVNIDITELFKEDGRYKGK